MVLQQDLYELFHNYWNLFTALNSYVTVLKNSGSIAGMEREATEEIAKLIPRLEALLESIRARSLSLVR